MDLDLSELTARERYKVLAGLVVPRPVAWVTTVDASGAVNLAPYSFFQVMSTARSRIGLGIGSHSDGTDKDTLRGIRDRREFVVNLSSVAQAEAVDRSSAFYPPGVSEAGQLGVALVDGVQVGVPRVLGAAASLECRLDQILPMGGNEFWVVGEVLHASVDDALMDSRLHVDYQRYKPLGRLVGALYVDTSAVFRVSRPNETTGASAC